MEPEANWDIPKTSAIYPELKGKTALVTGAGKGIGKDCVRELAAQGCNVIAVSRTQSDLDELVSLYGSGDSGSKITTKSLDISDWDKSEEWFKTIPPIHFLVNNAGVVQPKKILEITKESLESVMNINFNAQFHFAQLAARNMIKNENKGVIINMSSVASRKALTQSATYCCSKAALNMLTQCLVIELEPHGIRSVCVCPGFVWTGMLRNAPHSAQYIKAFQNQNPQCRIGNVEDVSRVVSFMLSDNACMITGSTTLLDSGLFS
ncbi:L-xylulose reductase-like [Symsagittifera roscoffensis]|uniref:L-xylulose reductase-like n=1 Tax=Symsagittifera roscoffensis TaxID=84072 RepID=UPI00307C2A1A